MLRVIQRVEGLGQKLLLDNYITSLALFDYLLQHKFNARGTVRHDRCGMPQDTGPKSLKMRRGDTVTGVRGKQRAVSWRDRHDVYILTHIHALPVKDNFTDEPCHVFKPHVVGWLRDLHGVCGQVRQMVNRYRIALKTWKCTRKLPRYDHSQTHSLLFSHSAARWPKTFLGDSHS